MIGSTSPSQGGKTGSTPVSRSTMFEPEHKSKFYLVFVLIVAIVIGWSIFTHYQPLIIQASCSEIAANSSNFIYKERELLDQTYSYDNIKTKCLRDSGVK